MDSASFKTSSYPLRKFLAGYTKQNHLPISSAGDLGYSKFHMIVDRLSNSYTVIPPSPCWTSFLVRLTRRTFAIEPDVSEKIDALVDGHTLEANLIVNKALRQYIEWGRFVENFKLVTSDPRLMKLFWSHLTVDEAREMGIQNGTSAVVEFILYYFRKFDLESLLKTFRVIGAEYSNAFVYSESGDERNRTIILRLSMGRSASAYYGASLKALSSRLGMEVEVEESDDQLVCKIRPVDNGQKVAVKARKS